VSGSVPPARAVGRALAGPLPSGTHQLLDSGHFPFVEDRAGLLAAVSGFFAGLR
jgi:pimeloyl-ACP methyl ester carboxylesterase